MGLDPSNLDENNVKIVWYILHPAKWSRWGPLDGSPPTRQLLSAILRFFGGVNVEESRPDEVEDILFNHGVATYIVPNGKPFGLLHVGSVEKQEVTDYIAQYDGGSRLAEAKERVKSMSKKMILFQLAGAEDIMFVTRYDWLENDRIVLNQKNTWKPSSREHWLYFIDARIVDSGDIDETLMEMIHDTMQGPQNRVKRDIIQSKSTRLAQALSVFAMYISKGMQHEFLMETRAAMDINMVNRSENIRSFEFRLKSSFKR